MDLRRLNRICHERDVKQDTTLGYIRGLDGRPDGRHVYDDDFQVVTLGAVRYVVGSFPMVAA